MHGSNLYDLAAAGGHLDILKILDSLKVKTTILSCSRRQRRFKSYQKMLQNGRSINERDAFEPHPLSLPQSLVR